MFSERYLSISSIVIMIFVITIGFNNCGEGFQTIGDGSENFFSNIISGEEKPRAPLVQESAKHVSISNEVYKLDIENGAHHIKELNNGFYTVVNDSANRQRPSLLYGSFDDLFSKNYKTAVIPNPNNLPTSFILDNYHFSVEHGELYIKMTYKDSNSTSYKGITYLYIENLGELTPTLYHVNQELTSSPNTFSERTPLSKNWDYYHFASSNKIYIRNSLTNEEINVNEKVKISENEEWLISKRDDNNCYVTNIETKQFTYLGPQSEQSRPRCNTYSFLNNNVIVNNYFNKKYISYISDARPNINIIEFQKSRTFEVPQDYFSYDKDTTAITYLDIDNEIKKQYLEDYLDARIPEVTYKTGTIEGFGKGQSLAYSINNQFQYYISSFSNQNSILVNNTTGKIIEIEKLIPKSNVRNNLNPNRRFASFYKFENQHYVTTDHISYYKVIFNDQAQQDLSLPEYNCTISETPKDKLSETCLWDLVNSDKQYKNFFNFNVRFPLKTETLDAKQRWVYLPPGTSIDNSDDDNWIYPKGTIFYKNFAYKVYADSKVTYKNIETRILEKLTDATGSEAWRPSVYLWNSEQTDASYTAEGADVPLNHKDIEYTYKVPNVASCTQCHRGNKDMAAGFTHLQLESGFGRLSTLKSHFNNGLLSKAPTVYDDIPSNFPDHKFKYSDHSINAIGYLSTNCSGCHSPTGFASFIGLDFTYKLGTTDPTQTNAYLTGVEKGKLKPGDHAGSRIFTAVDTGYMPKGAVNADKTLANQLKAWIDSFSDEVQ